MGQRAVDGTQGRRWDRAQWDDSGTRGLRGGGGALIGPTTELFIN